jgi:hypothetical protein
MQPQPVAKHEPLTIEVSGRRLVLLSPLTAMILGGLLLILVIVGWTLSALDHQLTIPAIGSGLVTTLIYAGVGVVVARQQPGNPVGWILILITLLTMLTVDGGAYAVLLSPPRPPWPLLLTTSISIPLETSRARVI